MDTQNKYISVLLHIHILGMCDWLFVDIGGLIDGTKSIPQRRRGP